MKALRSPAVRKVVSENTPVLRKTMLNAVDAERKIARQAFQREADIMTRKFRNDLTGAQRMISEATKTAAKNRRFRGAYMDLYEESNVYQNMINESDLSNMTRGQINKKIMENAELADILDDFPYEKTNKSYAENYLKAKGGVIRDSIQYLTPEQKKKALESQLGKSILRRQGPK